MKVTARQLTLLIREALAGSKPRALVSGTRDKHVLYARVAGALDRMQRRLHKNFLDGGWESVTGGIYVWLSDVPPPSVIDELVRMGFDAEIMNVRREGPALFVRHSTVESVWKRT
jgi:hypothetical protein